VVFLKLAQWLQKIEAFHPSEIKLGLERVNLLAKRLGILNLQAKIITVAGTNGKGSCVAMLESLAIHSGLKVGCYTSPHLVRFNERIRLNATNIDDQTLINAFESVEKQRQKLSQAQNSDFAITFFEFTTLAAFIIFKQTKLDLVVLEVGLGGRLDAVNIIEPHVAMVTTIALDHQSWLGSKLEQIAFEKSGIFRRNITNFVGDERSQGLILKSRPELLSHVALPTDELSSQLEPLVGDKQVNPRCFLKQNLALAVAGFQQLFAQEFRNLNLTNTIKYIALDGRLQVISQRPLIILDVAHNEQSAKNLSVQLDSIAPRTAKLKGSTRRKGKRFAICGMMADKSICRVISALASTINHWFFVDLPANRAISAFELNKIATEQDPTLKSSLSTSVSAAYSELKSIMTVDDQLIIFGSFITAAEMLEALET